MNNLRLLKEFRDVLDTYEMSDNSREILKRAKLVLLVAPTSAGRNTIIRELLKTGDYHFIVSDTTRQPRVNDGVPEQNGVEYWFRSEEAVLKDLRAGAYLEAAIIHNQQVSGISIYELETALNKEKIAITDIEIVGVENIMKAENQAFPVFVLPPSFKEWQRRLKHRGKMSQDEVHRRMESAASELAAAIEHDYYTFVINDEITNAASQIHQLAVRGLKDPRAQLRGRQLAEKLYVETRQFLAASKP